MIYLSSMFKKGISYLILGFYLTLPLIHVCAGHHEEHENITHELAITSGEVCHDAVLDDHSSKQVQDNIPLQYAIIADQPFVVAQLEIRNTFYSTPVKFFKPPPLFHSSGRAPPFIQQCTEPVTYC